MFRKRHTKSERPLLPESNFLGQAARQRLVDHSYNIWGMGSLGFGMLATNVVLSHGAPDMTPMIFGRQRPAVMVRDRAVGGAGIVLQAERRGIGVAS